MPKFGLRMVFIALLLLVGRTMVSAQSANALTNPSLEEDSFGPYQTRRGGLKPIYIPSGWNYWIAPQVGDFANKADDITIWPHPGPTPNILDGSRALNVDCAWITCTIAIYQQFPATPNANVQASAWAQVKACDFVEPSTSCGSAVESGSQTRIGIDPNGGTDPNDADVVWSGWVQPHDQWKQMTVSATTTGSTATIFLYNTQSSKARLNETYWDSVSVSGGGAGGAAPGSTPAATVAPTAPPFVGFVVPQNAQEDGSIVHTIQPGDTIDSIAFAYGVTRTQILELNNLSNPRIISIGQKLIIKTPEPGAGSGSETAGGEAPETTAELEAAAPAAMTPPSEGGAAAGGEETVPILPATQESQQVADAGQPEETAPEQNTEPTPAPPQPTALQGPAPVTQVASNDFDPAATTASVCVMLFDDANQNRIQEPGETSLAGGAIALNSGGSQAGSVDTEASPDPYCFEDLAAGAYVASASAPAGYGLTTADQFQVQLYPGAQINVAFGASQGVQPAAPPPADAGGIVNEVAAQETDARSLADQIINNAGLIVFGLAGVVLIGGLGLSLLLRRR
jgi:LysM repeat protein